MSFLPLRLYRCFIASSSFFCWVTILNLAAKIDCHTSSDSGLLPLVVIHGPWFCHFASCFINKHHLIGLPLWVLQCLDIFIELSAEISMTLKKTDNCMEICFSLKYDSFSQYFLHSHLITKSFWSFRCANC